MSARTETRRLTLAAVYAVAVRTQRPCVHVTDLYALVSRWSPSTSQLSMRSALRALAKAGVVQETLAGYRLLERTYESACKAVPGA